MEEALISDAQWIDEANCWSQMGWNINEKKMSFDIVLMCNKSNCVCF